MKEIKQIIGLGGIRIKLKGKKRNDNLEKIDLKEI